VAASDAERRLASSVGAAGEGEGSEGDSEDVAGDEDEDDDEDDAAAAGPESNRVVDSLAALASAAGATVEEILEFTEAELTELAGEENVGVVHRARIVKEAATLKAAEGDEDAGSSLGPGAGGGRGVGASDEAHTRLLRTSCSSPPLRSNDDGLTTTLGRGECRKSPRVTRARTPRQVREGDDAKNGAGEAAAAEQAEEEKSAAGAGDAKEGEGEAEEAADAGGAEGAGPKTRTPQASQRETRSCDNACGFRGTAAQCAAHERACCDGPGGISLSLAAGANAPGKRGPRRPRGRTPRSRS
jgi:hypothetical protein